MKVLLVVAHPDDEACGCGSVLAHAADSGYDATVLVAAEPGTAAGQVQAVIDELDPDVVITLDASDGHRDHAATRDATLVAVSRAWRPPARVHLCRPAEPVETDWRPSHSELVSRYQSHAHSNACWWDVNEARWQCVRSASP